MSHFSSATRRTFQPAFTGIQQWSDHHDRRGPDSDAETLAFFANYVGKLTKTREDIRTWADLLDLDDYVSFGGKA